jgi:hypothetical protein
MSEGLFEHFAPTSLGIIYGDWEFGTPQPTSTWKPPPPPQTTTTKAATTSTWHASSKTMTSTGTGTVTGTSTSSAASSSSSSSSGAKGGANGSSNSTATTGALAETSTSFIEQVEAAMIGLAGMIAV